MEAEIVALLKSVIALLKSLITSLKPGPSLLLGQLMTLVVTWGAVFFTNKTNKNLMIKQLEHASDEKIREREMGLRREVYLPAIEAISEARYLLVMCADLDAPDSKIVGLQRGLDASVGKMILIGSNKTRKMDS